MADHKLPNGADLAIIRDSYSWTIDYDGQVHGLTAGDHGYEPTGIVCDKETVTVLKQAQLFADEFENISDTWSKLAGAEFGPIGDEYQTSYELVCDILKAVRSKKQ